MSQQTDLSATFLGRVPEYERLRSHVGNLISQYKDTLGQSVVRSYSSRIKEEQRFLKKSVEKGLFAKNVWEEVFDVLGFRMICLFRDEIKLMEDEFIKEHFHVIESRNYEWPHFESTAKTLAEVEKVLQEGYTSTHFIVTLKSESNHTLKDWPFEIQCRTMLEDSWAELSHEMYEAENVPDDIKLHLVALSRYVGVVDDHFVDTRDRYRSLRPTLTPSATMDYQGADFSNKDFFHADLTGYNLRNTNFSGAQLFNCTLNKADLSGANFIKAQVTHCKLRGSKVVKADLSDAQFFYADMTDANLSSSNLEKCNLSYADLTRARLDGIRGRYLDLAFATLRQTSFRNADLREAQFVFNYYLDEADLSTSDMTGSITVKRNPSTPS
jgi:uncharacterized protein YjbI with pentapeptide repeats